MTKPEEPEKSAEPKQTESTSTERLDEATTETALPAADAAHAETKEGEAAALAPEASVEEGPDTVEVTGVEEAEAPEQESDSEVQEATTEEGPAQESDTVEVSVSATAEQESDTEDALEGAAEASVEQDAMQESDTEDVSDTVEVSVAATAEQGADTEDTLEGAAEASVEQDTMQESVTEDVSDPDEEASEETSLAEPAVSAGVTSGVTTVGINGIVLSLHAFEGPMHLLLHLIHEQNIDIFDIPIHKIANDFQAYVDLIQTLDLDLAGDYLTMAAELMTIKSRMLLPREKDDEDPRDDLVQRLLEYKQVRNATRFLKKQKKLGEDVFMRGTDAVSVLPDMPLPKARAKSDDLMGLFAKMLSKFAHTQGPFHAINFEKITVRQQIDWVCARFGEEHEELLFSELFAELGSRLEIIVTFLALLELGRLKHVRLQMTEEGDDIRVRTNHSLVGLELGEIDSFDYSMDQQQVGNKSKEKSGS